MKKNTLTKAHKISIIGIALASVIGVGGWFAVAKSNTIFTPNSPCSINTIDQKNGTNTVNCKTETEREIFNHGDIKNKFETSEKGSFIKLPLKFKPSQNSLNVTWGPENIIPKNISLDGNILTIRFDNFSAEQMKNGSDVPFVVMYSKDI